MDKLFNKRNSNSITTSPHHQVNNHNNIQIESNHNYQHIQNQSIAQFPCMKLNSQNQGIGIYPNHSQIQNSINNNNNYPQEQPIVIPNINLDDEIEKNYLELKQMKYFIEKVNTSRNDLDDIFHTLKKICDKDYYFVRSKEEFCNPIIIHELIKISSRVFGEINAIPEENDIIIPASSTEKIPSSSEYEIERLKRRETVDYFVREIERIKQYYPSNFPNLFEFINRPSSYPPNFVIPFLKNSKFSIEQLNDALCKISSGSNPCLIILCFNNELKYSELDDTFYICFVLKELMTLSTCFKKLIEEKPNELITIHSFVWSTLFEESEQGTLKGFNPIRFNNNLVSKNNNTNMLYSFPREFNNFGNDIAEELSNLREIVFKNYNKIKLPCLYPKTKIFQNLTHALNIKYFTANEVSVAIYNKPNALQVLFEDALRFCEGIYKDRSRCVICNERIQFDMKNYLGPVHYRDKNENYSHYGCFRTKMRSNISTPFTIEIPFEVNFLNEMDDDDHCLSMKFD